MAINEFELSRLNILLHRASQEFYSVRWFCLLSVTVFTFLKLSQVLLLLSEALIVIPDRNLSTIE